MDDHDIELPSWFDPDDLWSEAGQPTSDAILDAAKLLSFEGVRFEKRGRKGVFDPDEYEWLPLEKLADRLHDSGVAAMVAAGYTWAPDGYVGDRCSHYIAPFSALGKRYQEEMKTEVLLAVRTIVEAGIELVAPSTSKGRHGDRHRR
jgi:hypothetical protein